MNQGKTLAKSTFAIIIFALLGKLLGFARESLTAYIFGADAAMDAFTFSQAATAMIGMLISQSIATTFIPSLQKIESDGLAERKNYFTNNMIWVSAFVSIIFIVLVQIFPKPFAMMTASKATPEVFLLTEKLIRIGIVVVVFSAWVGIFTGYLQYNNKFAAAGAVAIPLNLVYIAYLMFFSHHVGIVGLTIASVVGILAQVIFLLPGALKVGYKPGFVLNFKDRYVREAMILSIPTLISVSINDINTAVNRNFASGMGVGAGSVLFYANKMNTMIMGIFIMAITAVVFPIMAKTFVEGDILQGKRVMNASVKLVLFLTVPSTIGLVILAKPIVEIAFLRGRFTPENAVLTTSALRYYSLSLISLSLLSVINRVYYSLQDTKTPFIIGVINVVINVGLNILVAHKFGTDGLAASLSIATTIAVLIAFYLLKVKIGNIGTKSYLKAIAKTVMASLVMGAFALVYFPFEALVRTFIHSPGLFTIARLIILIVVVSIAAAIYCVILYLLGVREIRDLYRYVNEKYLKNRIRS